MLTMKYENILYIYDTKLCFFKTLQSQAVTIRVCALLLEFPFLTTKPSLILQQFCTCAIYSCMEWQ